MIPYQLQGAIDAKKVLDCCVRDGLVATACTSGRSRREEFKSFIDVVLVVPNG
jgi:hypothetical protein